MAMDSTLEDVPDTPANALHYGRLSSGKSASPFPQMRCLYLAEVGTHVLVDAVPAPCSRSEHYLAPVLLRSIEPDMLVLTDRNFPFTDWISCIRQKQAHLASNRFTKPDRLLADGSSWHTLSPSNGPAFQVRVIEYRLIASLVNELTPLPCSRNSDPAKPGAIHRLVTTLLDPEQAPALELILCYHERWEIEEVIGETKTSLRLSKDPLRSQDPVLVYQEFYGLLLAHAIEILHQACAQAPVRAEALAHFTQRILSDLRDPSSLLPPRRLRFYPRVLKRAQASFVRKRPHHHGFELKNTPFRDVLLIW
jgi:hypothetical protein